MPGFNRTQIRLAAFLKNNHNFLFYSIIGVTGVAVDFGIFFFLVEVLGWNTILSNSISVTLAITNNFSLNAIFNFKVKNKIPRRFLSFYLIGIIGLLLTNLVLYIFVDILGADKLVTKFFSIIVVVLVQYTLNIKYSFYE